MYNFYSKLLLVMRLTLLILLAALMQVSAATFAQKVTLSEKNALLTTVFNDIRSQTGYDFIVTKTVMDQSKTITIEVKNAELADVLKQIFQDEPLDYQITDKSVLVKLKDPNLPDKLKNAINLNQIDVTGIVLDEQGRPVSGATVTVKNTSNAIITDAKGGFHLKNVADNATIVISFIGYQKQELPAQTDMGKIKLVIATNALDAVQVVAYGETTQRLTTGNISGVTAEEIERQPVDNPLLALEGKVPGLFVAQTNGAPNSAVTVQIQGQNSIQSGNDPLYVIDGVPYNSETMMQGGIGGTNPLSYVNPTDIQSIEVLKDAEATSIYGSRAANGAILITTKKGKAGTTKVDFDFQDGFSRDTRMIPLMNTEQYIAMREEAFSNDGTTPSANPNNGVDYAPDLTLWNTNSYTNWQKVLLGGTGQAITTRGSISGGNENTQFLISGNYNKESSIYPGNFSDQKSSVLVNLNNTSPNKKFKTEFSASYMYDNNSLPYYDPYQLALSLPPDAPQIYNTDGTLNWAPNSAGESSWLNPLAYTLQTYDAKTNNLVSSITLNYNILPGLNILSTFGYTNQQSYELSEMPLSSIAPEYRQYGQNSAEYTNSDVNSWNIEPQVTYKRQISKGTLDAVVGETFHQDSGTNQNTTGYGYNSDLNLADMGSASTLTATSGEYTYKYTAFFARTNYNWEDKYIVDASARRDGSSRFGSANQFHDFAAGGAAWIFSKEKLIEDNLSFLSFGKFKVSYGSTGNDQIGNYQYLSSYGATGPYQGAKGLSPGGLTNPFLQWELTKKANFGIDLGFLNDRILV
jgi:TonB-linked SusC/RagA family outer membrane protein